MFVGTNLAATGADMVTRKVDVTNLLAFDLNTATCCLSYQVFSAIESDRRVKESGAKLIVWEYHDCDYLPLLHVICDFPGR